MDLMRPIDEKLNALRRFKFIGMSIFLLLLGIMVVPTLVIRQTEIVTITRNDAARDCKSREFYKIWPKYRSSRPRNFLNYCETVMSDHGSFNLPETTWINLLGTPRAVLYDTVRGLHVPNPSRMSRIETGKRHKHFEPQPNSTKCETGGPMHIC